MLGELTPPDGEHGWRQDVLDHGFVELVNCSPGHVGDVGWSPTFRYVAMDISVADSARVSFAKRAHEMGAAEVGLVRRLMKDHHGTPFEHQHFTFHVRAPIFVFREWHRHRTASISEASARYTIVPNLFYVPAAEDMRVQIGKAADYHFEEMARGDANLWRDRMRARNSEAFEFYEEMLTADPPVAKEVARTVLPVSMYSEMRWTVSARNLMGFLSLRNAPQAQREIAAYARSIESMFEQVMPVTAQAFIDYGREKP